MEEENDEDESEPPDVEDDEPVLETQEEREAFYKQVRRSILSFVG